MVCRRGHVTPANAHNEQFQQQEVQGKMADLGNSSLEQVVCHRQGGGVHRGHHQHGNIWVWRRMGSKVERDVNPAAIKESDGFEVT